MMLLNGWHDWQRGGQEDPLIFFRLQAVPSTVIDEFVDSLCGWNRWHPPEIHGWHPKKPEGDLNTDAR
jgi:hypothetical protein